MINVRNRANFERYLLSQILAGSSPPKKLYQNFHVLTCTTWHVTS